MGDIFRILTQHTTNQSFTRRVSEALWPTSTWRV